MKVILNKNSFEKYFKRGNSIIFKHINIEKPRYIKQVKRKSKYYYYLTEVSSLKMDDTYNFKDGGLLGISNLDIKDSNVELE